jgi:spermidine/putrescine transport system substrate-binding protein
MGWIGDVYLAQKNNPEVQFVYPKDGYVVWIDSIAIVKNAPHLEAAYQFVNFLYQPKIAEEISAFRGYASPEKAATALLPANIQDNPLENPPLDKLKGPHVYFQDYLGQATNKLYQHYWTLLKLGAGS